jgi:hypothetical protein
VEVLESRLAPYAVSGNAWPHPELITISFVPDGTLMTTGTSGNMYSNLFAAFNTKFGSAAAWQNQILRAAQMWAQQTNLNFSVVSDSGAYEGSGNYEQGDPGVGDIRIGGYNFGSLTLAQAYMPPPANNYSIAGDLQFNTGQAFHIGTTYDLFTVALHEFGHALGMEHTSLLSAAMFPTYTGAKANLSADDIAGIRSVYSGNNPRSQDAFQGSNNSFATAADLTSSLNAPMLQAITTGLDITSTSQAEYFTAVAPALTSWTLTVSVQSTGQSLLSPTLNVYDAGQALLGSASGAGQYGTTLSVTLTGITAGARYYLKVGGADTTAFSTGHYGLVLNFGTLPTATLASTNTQTPNGNPLTGGGGLADTYDPQAQNQFLQADLEAHQARVLEREVAALTTLAQALLAQAAGLTDTQAHPLRDLASLLQENAKHAIDEVRHYVQDVFNLRKQAMKSAAQAAEHSHGWSDNALVPRGTLDQAVNDLLFASFETDLLPYLS